MEQHVATPQRASSVVRLAILGSTGSVGRQTLEVVDAHPERFRVVALAGGANSDLLRAQALRYRPDLVAIAEPDLKDRHELGRVEVGPDGLLAAATHAEADVVVVATAGNAAMLPTYRAIEAGKTIALANKETIVCAGELIVPFAAERGVEIRPVDSEHSAIWQAIGFSPANQIARLILTASGGPFREMPRAAMAEVTASQALAHPTWSMGGKITVDSATLMNKGLEVIEAARLFGVPFERIEVLIHPESIVHSLVEFVDGSQIAQLGLPDMRLPIQYALTFPERVPTGCRALSLADVGSLHFAAPDGARFPALGLAREAGRRGNTYPTVLSAADEVAVAAFLAGRIRFLDVASLVGEALDRHELDGPVSFASIAAADAWARDVTESLVRQRGTSDR